MLPEDRELDQHPKVLSTKLIDWRPVERGENFAVLERIRSYTMDNGVSGSSTNRYTVLGNGMHYLEDGEWKESEDIIEVFPEGAVARKGPNRTIFSPDLNAEAVFDMLTSAGDRIRGGVRSIQITDARTGASQVIAEVKNNAPGKLFAPNRIVYSDAFNGLEADVLYQWKHNRFSQNVILLERPEIPQEMDAQDVRLEVVTEFVEAPDPLVKRKFRQFNQLEIIDDAIIEFENLLVVPGKAVSTQGGGFSVDSPNFLREDGIHVSKEWVEAENNRNFLIESIGWMEAQAALQELPPRNHAQHFTPSTNVRILAEGRLFAPSVSRNLNYPMELANVDYNFKGFLIDYTTLPGTYGSYTFESGETYYVTTSGFYTGGTTTFESGAVIKQAPNASAAFLTYGPLNFPSGTLDNAEKVIFTSKDDDFFGEVIDGSDGIPDYHADPALMVYYVDFANSIDNAWFRWAKYGIEFYTNPSDDPVHEIYNCYFHHCQTSIYTDSYSDVDLVDSEKCDSGNPTGNVNGSLTQAIFCVDQSIDALSHDDGGQVDPADTMGAIGPNHYVEMINRKIAIYNKSTGGKTESADADDFFDADGHPFADPRILYDEDTGRWIACMLDRNTDDLKIAISEDTDPSNLTSANDWKTYSADVDETGKLTDYPTLGVDENGVYVALHYFTLSWDGNNEPVWPANPWSSSLVLSNYFDLDLQKFWDIPQKGSPSTVNINMTGSRFQMAVIRNGKLWTCHHIGLDGGNYDYDSTTNEVDRFAIQWLKCSVNYTSKTLSLDQEGRIFDTASSNPKYYFFPSLNVNDSNEMVIGFGGSSADTYFSAFYSYKTSSGSTPASPLIIGSGTFPLYSGVKRWGDYSYTTVDPVDDDTFWTVQLRSKEEIIGLFYDTIIAKILP